MATGYRDMIVHCDETGSSVQRTHIAARLAKQFGAHLTGIFLRPSFPYEYFGPGCPADLPLVIPASVQEAHDRDMDRLAIEAHGKFEAAALVDHVALEWREVRGDDVLPFIDCMHLCDLTVCSTVGIGSWEDSKVTSAHLVMTSGDPVLLLPDMQPNAEVGSRILIAWNNSREASRALRAAQPFLAQAKEVFVLIVSPDGQEGPPGMLEDHLHRLGCSPTLLIERQAEGAIVEQLAQKIAGHRINLLVMGLYGHGQFRELVLGGASREMLREAQVPMLVSH